MRARLIQTSTASFSLRTNGSGKVVLELQSRLRSNGPHIRLWKTELQQFADETQMEIHVAHYNEAPSLADPQPTFGCVTAAAKAMRERDAVRFSRAVEGLFRPGPP